MRDASEPEPGAKGRLRRLECLRGVAALYVFVHHYVHVALTPHYPKLGLPFKFGQLAVLIFFVVSGFVIYYSALGRARREAARAGEPSEAQPALAFRPYFIRRFRRIYPPFVAALLLTYGVQCLIEGGVADPRWRELGGNLLMLQDENVASWFAPYLNNSSLWSLSYEWAFYLLFFAVYALTRKLAPSVQKWVVGGAALAAFGVYMVAPNQLALFVMYLPIWWAGVELAREYMDTGEVTVRAQLVPLAFVVALAGLWLIPLVQALDAGQQLVMWKHPVVELRHFVTAVFILVCALGWHKLRWVGFYTLLGPFERVAPISYGLYIVHKPFVHLAATRAPLGNVWLELVWVVPVVFALAWLVERWLHQYVLRLLPVERKGD